MEGNEVNTAETDEMKYFYYVYDLPPEMKARMAFRRAGHSELHARKVIKCPFCGEELTHVDREIKVELYRHPAKKSIACHQYLICDACANETGFKFAV